MKYMAIASALLLSQAFAGGLASAAPISPTTRSGPAEAASTGGVPRAVAIARTTAIPNCTVFVDAASKAGGDGAAQRPHKTIAAAVEAADPGAVICVAEGVYAEQLAPGEKYFTLAGGFQRGKDFKVRDSAAFVTTAKGRGGSFIRIADPGPRQGQLTAIDGFEITGYSQAIYRDIYYSQRFDITNNLIHHNTCADIALAGGGVALNNVSGTISGNVIANNTCGRGGAVFVNDDSNKNTVRIENNRIDANAGVEPDSSHGGAIYVFVNKISIIGNTFTNNTVTNWGAGLYVGAYRAGGQIVSATMAWNVYKGNKAGVAGGGSFCDDGASCVSEHEIYHGNCGGNIYLDSGAEGSGGTVAKFNHLTSVGALDVACSAPGDGLRIDKEGTGLDTYSITNAIFWGNAHGRDIAATCMSGCKAVKVTVAHSMVQPAHQDGMTVTFGPGIVPPSDPLFADPAAGDFHLKSAGGRWTPAGIVTDAVTSPAIGKGDPAGPVDKNPKPAGNRIELGAYGNSSEASYSRSAAAQAATPAQTATPAPPAPAPTPAPAPAVPPRPAAQATPSQKTADARAPVAVADNRASAQADDVTAKEAFEAARVLGTVEAWDAFLKRYPSGFYADLARAYVKNLGSDAPEPAVAPIAAPQPQPTADPANAKPDDGKPADGLAPTRPGEPAVARGGSYMGFPEQFNRYYTDPAWKPSQTVYVSPDGSGDGTTRDAPMSVHEAVQSARPGTQITFLRGKYQGCFEFSKEASGAYDAPIVLYGERNPDKSPGVAMSCCKTGRQTCFNLEGADHIAIDGFELIGGKYGVRAVGAGYAASEHSKGIAVMSCRGHDQSRDPFFSGQADWAVWEGNVAYGAKAEDGHGIYISNGSDWNIVRFNETYSNLSSDFQINADPASTCKEVGIPFDDPRCDAYAGEGEGGQGASDYFLVDGNYFHHGLAHGANFTSVRRSIIRNNIFGPQTRHNVSFWQETDNPKLGSSDNKIVHNLFVTTGRHGVKFENNSTRNVFANNVILGVQVKGGAVTANPSALLMEVDDTVGDNAYRANLYVSGKIEGRDPNDEETTREDFSPDWFTAFPKALNHDPNDLTPTAQAPFLGMGAVIEDAAADRNGTIRSGEADAGPIELP